MVSSQCRSELVRRALRHPDKNDPKLPFTFSALLVAEQTGRAQYFLHTVQYSADTPGRTKYRYVRQVPVLVRFE